MVAVVTTIGSYGFASAEGASLVVEDQRVDGRDAVSPFTGKIAFASARDGDYEIFTMNADGTGLRQLTKNDANDLDPEWSPDGKWIAFTAGGSRPGVGVMRADGTDLSLLISDFTVDPSWSPDGRRMVISWLKTFPDDYELHILDLQRSGSSWEITKTTQVTDNSADDVDPEWSPDGSRIAWSSGEFPDHDIYVGRPDGSDQQNLTELDALYESGPSWSLDSSKIVSSSGAVTSTGGEADVYVMNADGSDRVELTSAPGQDWYTDWSADGIAFVSQRDTNHEIYLMKLDGSNQTRLTDDPAHDIMPDWIAGTPRTVTIAASRRRVARGRSVRIFGKVSGTTGCVAQQRVSLTARRGGSFKVIAKTRTRSTGVYSFRFTAKRTRRYRAVAPAGGSCPRAVSSSIRVRVR